MHVMEKGRMQWPCNQYYIDCMVFTSTLQHHYIHVMECCWIQCHVMQWAACNLLQLVYNYIYCMVHYMHYMLYYIQHHSIICSITWQIHAWLHAIPSSTIPLHALLHDSLHAIHLDPLCVILSGIYQVYTRYLRYIPGIYLIYTWNIKLDMYFQFSSI